MTRTRRLGFRNLTGPGLPGHLIALSAGCTLPLSLAPFDIWPLGFVSVFLLAACLQGIENRMGAFRNYLFGLGMYGVGVSWIYVSIHEYGGASVGLAVALVALFVASISTVAALQGYLYVRFFRNGYWGTVLGFSCLWVAQEWFRTWVLTGFPWLFLGYGVMETPLAHLAPVTGVLGVSLAVALTASMFFALVYHPHEMPNQTHRKFVSLALVGSVWLAALLLSQQHWVEPVTDGELSVSLVQGNIDQRIKWRREMIEPILDLYWQMSQTEWEQDLIVWPEAAITLFKHRATDFLDKVDSKGKQTNTAVITGIPTIDPETQAHRNSVVALGMGSGTYQKRRLVPFGEYVPLEQWLRGLITFFNLPMSHNNSGPMEQDPMLVGPWKVSTSICYEVVYPELVRRSVAAPDFLLTISNDTWFGKSIGPIQHMQMARMRALENGRYLIRATNNGVTAIVDEQGHILRSLPQFTRGILRGEVKVMSGTTPFSRWGSLPVLLVCGLGLLLAAVTGRAQVSNPGQ
ncbi:MAG: apolipoprotein N-acyltransferase [Gammaproteobacteria bacterium]|nr:apolipoprotein N-acyltransferase [Gammaproteobacteria bacterium]